MNNWIDFDLVLIVLTSLALLGSSRLGSCIRIVALQGVILSPLALLLGGEHGITLRAAFLAVVTVVIKGAGFPWLLDRAVRDASARKEVDPFLGYNASILAGVLILAVSFRLSAQLPLPAESISSLVVPVAFFNILAGLLVIATRRKAVTQVLGYLVMENGIYVFGVGAASHQPLLVELGILLDVFAAVFVMGIVIFHIGRQFDHIDTDRLTNLRDWGKE
jgi:hydrogenase-4 component E